MEPRLDIINNDFAMKVVKYFVSANKVAADSTLPAATQELVKIRASQINGCGFCLDMHTKDAAEAGETAARLNLVACWREATVFTEAERAALELAEHGTRIADGGGVSDEVWANAAKHYDDEQLLALVSQIAIINAFNRLNVILQRPAGDYQPGQFGSGSRYQHDDSHRNHPTQHRHLGDRPGSLVDRVLCTALDGEQGAGAGD